MNDDLLIRSATALTDGEAGGHGDRRGVVHGDSSAFMRRWLGVALEKSEVPILDTSDAAALQDQVMQLLRLPNVAMGVCRESCPLLMRQAALIGSLAHRASTCCAT